MKKLRFYVLTYKKSVTRKIYAILCNIINTAYILKIEKGSFYYFFFKNEFK